MIKRILHIGILVSLLSLLSCSDDPTFLNGETSETGSGTAVEIFVEGIGDISTRQVDNPKRAFQYGDRIHVEGTFYDEEDNFVERSYKVFEMNLAGEWTVAGNAAMYWPANAKYGDFKSYYISRFTEILEKGDIKRGLRLSDIDDQTDPLYAEARLDWGHKVNLHFNHICTHLTFTNLDPDITDYFWLVNKNETDSMANTFNIWLTSENELKTEFKSIPDADYNGLVYVQHRSKNLYDGNIKTGSEVSFFLKPSDYSNIELRTINNYPYLAFKSELTADLLPNVPYVIDIKVNKGVTFVEDEEVWEDDDATIDIFDPEDFLQSIVDGTDYSAEVNGEKVRILQSTSAGTLLCRNVSFKYNKDYSGRFEVPSGRCFDGGNHFISEVAANLFSTNYGTIQHLGIKNIQCDVELSYSSSGDYSRWGVLCELNSGIIKNVRIENESVKFKIGEGRGTEGVVFNIGSLTGSNGGNISGLQYGEGISIVSEVQDDINATVYMGGICGQTVRLIEDVSPIDGNARIEVISHLQGDLASLYLGGAVGLSTSDLQNISLTDVLIDASDSKGVVGNTGGIAGRLTATVGDPSTVSSCTVAGTVKGMPVSPYDMIKAYSYTGGLAGYVNNFDVENCRSLCDVMGAEGVEGDANTTYATGGGFGRIVTENRFSGNYIIGNILTGPEDYLGNFSGLVPAPSGWEVSLPSLNVVKEIIPGKFTGGSIDDTSND